MHRFGAQLEQIQLLIHRVQDHSSCSRKSSFRDCCKLLKLSQQLDYSYGLAVANAYMAQHAWAEADHDGYRFHVTQATDLARQKGYRDVLITCITLEGLHCADHCDESGAMSLFLDGVKLADKVGDSRAQGIFYYHIADLFYGLGAHSDAADFYTMALDSLRSCPHQTTDFHQGMSLINLARLACLQGNPDQATHYLKQCSDVVLNSELLALLALEIQARIACLEHRPQEALRQVEALLSALTASPEPSLALRPLYLSLMELLLRLEHRAHAAWCLERIGALYAGATGNVALRIRRLHVQYADTFHLPVDDSLDAFHLATQQGEQATWHSTANSFKSLITLFESEKEQRRMLEERNHLLAASERDELTRIYNRRYYSKLISKLLLDRQVHTLGYLMVDVDFFKEYNDCYGHAAGDGALRAVALLLELHLPAGSFAARYGGDEFSCLFVNRTSQEISDFVSAVQKGLQQKDIKHLHGGPTGQLTLSFGLYNTNRLHNCDEFDLIRHADKALYQAKQQGRNTFALFCDEREGHET